MANHACVVELLDEERQELERLLRSQTSTSGLVRCARAVFLMAYGKSGAELARLTRYTRVQISRIRRRLADERTGGLSEKPRSGRPQVYGPFKTAEIVAPTFLPTSEGLNHWSTREQAEDAGVSHTTVDRIWWSHDLQPHRVQTFTFSRNGHLEEKIPDVVGLYLNPPTNAFIVSVDENTQGQALNRRQPLLPLRLGIPARQTPDYKRNGLTSLYGALKVATGRVVGEYSPTHRGPDFLRFLKKVARRFPQRQLHVIVDNSSTLSTPDVTTWLSKQPRVHFHFTPTSASWMNLVEPWFGSLRR